MERVKYLDHGFVELVGVLGNDEMVVSFARSSFGHQEAFDSEKKNRSLIRYLIEHHHTSPLECGEVVFNLKMPIFVARQHVRHRTASLSELSMRYQEAPEHFYIPDLEHICLQDAWNKQGSGDPLKPHVAEALQTRMRETSEMAWDTYKMMIEAGVAKETARMVLPVNWYTQMSWKMDLKNFLHYCRLRNDGHAQYEIREMARIMEDLVRPHFPMVFEAFDEHVRGATTFSRGEIQHVLMYELNDAPDDLAELVEIASKSLGSKRRGRELYKKLGYCEEDLG